MKILKFGGTSLANADRIRRAAAIAADRQAGAPLVVVVSALGGVTNQLLEIADLAAGHDESWRDGWSELRELHRETASALAPRPEAEALVEAVTERFGDLEDLLHGVFLLRECSPRSRDSIQSFGERLSAPLFAAELHRTGSRARSVDARSLVVTDDAFGRARVLTDPTREAIRRQLSSLSGSEIAVVTGFVAATERCETTTLGRGGSDYTASILGEALEAEAIELWTDVSGVLSADPRVVPEAFPLERISYDELMELSHFGAKVVHPPSVHPARRGGIPLAIRNTLDPEAAGTVITGERAPNRFDIRGITSIPRVDLLRLEGDGMVGVPGIAMRLFGCLARAEVSVILISQASSEHSICWAVAPEATEAARRAVTAEFELELRVGAVDPLIVDRDQAVIAVVGEEMRERPGIASRLFGSLAARGINVRAVAQGSSELNISCVVAADDQAPALRSLHSTFFEQPRPRVRLVLLGCGQVGREVLRQSRTLITRWRDERGVDVRWVAIANSRRIAMDAEGLPPEDWEARLEPAPEGGVDELLEFLALAPAPTVVVDATASETIGTRYIDLVEAGCGLVAANKKPFCRPWTEFHELTRRASDRGLPVRLEATVGAGLPVVSTLLGQLAAGDEARSIVAVVSGTLNYLCEELRHGRPFGQALREADRLGFLEPDPWDDLSGEDARRKICILARLAGHPLELSDVESTPFLPGDGWADLSPDRLWERVDELDDHFGARAREAEERGERLRYVAELAEGKATVGLRAVGPDHPCHTTEGSESLVAFSTLHYDAAPLVVRGPGAGPGVTASGVLVDVVAALEALVRSPSPLSRSES